MNRSALILSLTTLLLWSCSATCMLRLVDYPSTRIIALSFLIGALAGVSHWRSWKVPLRTFLLGASCFLGYRLTVMAAFKLSPGIETNLVNGLQPMLLVLLAPAVLSGYPLRPHHLVGVTLGFVGAICAVAGGGVHFELRFLPGYACSAFAALMWSVYALLLKRQAPFPSMAVGGFLAAAGITGLVIDQILSIWQPPAPPMTPASWLWVVALGLGPTGIAYITWDAAIKRGDPRVIGSIMYLSPLTSTALIALINHKPLSWGIALGAVLLTIGATVSSWEMLRDAIRGAPAEPAGAGGAR